LAKHSQAITSACHALTNSASAVDGRYEKVYVRPGTIKHIENDGLRALASSLDEHIHMKPDLLCAQHTNNTTQVLNKQEGGASQAHADGAFDRSNGTASAKQKCIEVITRIAQPLTQPP
jgi:hypothetical protein